MTTLNNTAIHGLEIWETSLNSDQELSCCLSATQVLCLGALTVSQEATSSRHLALTGICSQPLGCPHRRESSESLLFHPPCTEHSTQDKFLADLSNSDVSSLQGPFPRAVWAPGATATIARHSFHFSPSHCEWRF